MGFSQINLAVLRSLDTSYASIGEQSGAAPCSFLKGVRFYEKNMEAFIDFRTLSRLSFLPRAAEASKGDEAKAIRCPLFVDSCKNLLNFEIFWKLSLYTENQGVIK